MTLPDDPKKNEPEQAKATQKEVTTSDADLPDDALDALMELSADEVELPSSGGGVNPADHGSFSSKNKPTFKDLAQVHKIKYTKEKKPRKRS